MKEMRGCDVPSMGLQAETLFGNAPATNYSECWRRKCGPEWKSISQRQFISETYAEIALVVGLETICKHDHHELPSDLTI
jgi:hypothetical protein